MKFDELCRDKIKISHIFKSDFKVSLGKKIVKLLNPRVKEIPEVHDYPSDSAITSQTWLEEYITPNRSIQHGSLDLWLAPYLLYYKPKEGYEYMQEIEEDLPGIVAHIISYIFSVGTDKIEKISLHGCGYVYV